MQKYMLNRSNIDFGLISLDFDILIIIIVKYLKLSHHKCLANINKKTLIIWYNDLLIFVLNLNELIRASA